MFHVNKHFSLDSIQSRSVYRVLLDNKSSCLVAGTYFFIPNNNLFRLRHYGAYNNSGHLELDEEASRRRSSANLYLMKRSSAYS